MTHLWQDVPAGVPCWHIHHGTLLEWSTIPLAKRAEYIRKNKPPHEVELRLRLMRPVKGELPEEVIVAGDAYAKVKDAYAKAWDARDRIVADHCSEIEALHAEECPDCPWDGTTIFPEKKAEEKL